MPQCIHVYRAQSPSCSPEVPSNSTSLSSATIHNLSVQIQGLGVSIDVAGVGLKLAPPSVHITITCGTLARRPLVVGLVRQRNKASRLEQMPSSSLLPPPLPPPSSRCHHSAMLAIAPQKQRSLFSCSAYLNQPPETHNSDQTSALSGEVFMEELLRGHLTAFRKRFKMPPTTFLALRAWVIRRGLLQLKRNTGMSLGQMLGIFLRIVGRNALCTFAMHRVGSSTANLPSPSSICMLTMFPATRL